MESKPPPPESFGPKKTYDSPLGSFEVIELQTITPTDIGPEDRAFIHTRSGNRYMIRHSKSRGSLVIYNEREGEFSKGNGHTFRIRSNNFASVGQRFEHFAMTDEASQKGNHVTSTEVTRIEIRKGLEAAVAKVAAESSSGISGSGIAQMLINEVHGRRTDPPSKE